MFSIRRCLGNYNCPNCKNKFILTFETFRDDEFFCCDTIEELHEMFEVVESGGSLEGLTAIPGTVIKLIPKSYKEGESK